MYSKQMCRSTAGNISTVRHGKYEGHLTYVSYMLAILLPQSMSGAALLTSCFWSMLVSTTMSFVSLC